MNKLDKPEDVEQFDMELAEPLPGREMRDTEADAEKELDVFAVAMAQMGQR